MLYAILAYHVEEEVTSWTPAEDAALMLDLNRVHDRLTRQGNMGPAARLGVSGFLLHRKTSFTQGAVSSFWFTAEIPS